ncbi:MAG TPA: hypothetical protein VL793_12040 [Patescibacteria group bacterium]|jgi:hypothetical protein|nr:hypothetical protein [Patescibacteria group bacterium]
MALFKKIGEFVKSHYEKILLSVTLLILAAAAAYLPLKISENQKMLRSAKEFDPAAGKGKLPPGVDLSTNQILFERMEKLTNLDLARPHNLLNPVTWKRALDGRLIKIDSSEKEGPGALVIAKIRPLNLTITFIGAAGTGDPPRYQFTVKNEADPNRSKRGNIPKLVALNAKSDFFTLKEVRGPADNPTELVLELEETKELVTVTKGKPFVRVNGYSADLSYPLEANKVFLDRRVKEIIEFGDKKYKIVAIRENEVTVEAIQTTARTTIRYNAPNAAR